MKHITLSYLATIFAAMTIVSCSNDITEQTSTKSTYMVPMTFTATQESSDDITRTVVSSNGKYVNWQQNDAVAVFDGSYATNQGYCLYNYEKFIVGSGVGTTSATLSGGSVAAGSNSYIAVYPYDEYYITPTSPTGESGIIDLAENPITIPFVCVPDEQTATENSFDPKAAVMTAVATKDNPKFAFKNVCSFLKITTNDPYKKITVSVSKGYIAGYGDVTGYGDNPVIDFTDYSDDYKKNTITLTSSSGMIAASTYYIAVAPGDISDIKVRCYTSDDTYDEKTITGDFTLKRSYYYSLGSMGTPNLMDGAYSVSATKKVLFTSGNLYWDGSDYHLESTQIGSSRDASTGDPTVDYTHLSYFYWTTHDDYMSGESKYMPYAETYQFTAQSVNDVFWCGVGNPLTVDGTNNLYVLTNDEWTYLLKDRDNAADLRKYGVTVTDGDNTYGDCLIIAPDEFKSTLLSSYTLAEINSLGLTCLPNVSCTFDTNGAKAFFTAEKGWGCYWSASPDDTETEVGDALNMCWSNTIGYFSPVEGAFNHEMRKFGQCIRLVWTYSDTTNSGN